VRVGLDLDNTILDYALSVEISAREALGLEIPRSLSKSEQKSWIIETAGQESWTLVQGYSYGAYSSAARVFPGFVDFLDYVLSKGHSVSVLSHKSEFPIAGPRIDLREAALETLKREGIWQRLITQGEGVGSIRFFETREEKIAGILTSATDVFVDDLIEVARSLHQIGHTFHIFCHDRGGCEKGVLCVQNWRSMPERFRELEQNA
jgi:hypothetical protein